MKTFPSLIRSTLALATVLLSSAQAQVINEIPGPDDMGGMIMPTIRVSGTTLSYLWTDTAEQPMPWNPATDSATLMSLGEVTDGIYFNPSTRPNYAYRLNPTSLGGLGNLFSTQFGFWVDRESSDLLSANNFLAIRVTSITDGLRGWNNPWTDSLTAVFSSIGDTVLWNGSMWHNLFTISPNAAPGIYHMTFEVFVMSGSNAPTWTGFISTSLDGFSPNSSYNSITIPYTFEVVPEPSAASLVLVVGGLWLLRRRQTRFPIRRK